MKNFNGKILFLDRSDINTDEIIPAKYLTELTKAALKPYCLEDLSLPGFDPKKDIEGKSAIVTRANFGCGSSREHAPQSLWHYGFRAIVAQSFAEIFFGNATTIGIPCVCASAGDIAKIGELIEADPETPVEINLGDMTVSCGDFSCKCSMPENARASLVSGTWDPIAGLIDAEAEIAETASKLPYFK